MRAAPPSETRLRLTEFQNVFFKSWVGEQKRNTVQTWVYPLSPTVTSYVFVPVFCCGYKML